MKYVLIFSLLILSLLSFSQEYKLFNASSKKVYTNYPVADSTFSIAFDSASMAGNDSVYYNFTRLGNITTSDTCQFWGSQECFRQDYPSWLGPEVVYNNSSSYTFFNVAGNTLNFDFSVSGTDSALFYRNSTEQFYIQFYKSDTLTVLNYTDSVRVYTIIHTDSLGNDINSAINGKKIIIAKNLGLVQFLQIDAFPDLLNSVYLLGNESPDLGFAKLTNEDLYSYAIGDEFQLYDYLHYNFPTPDNHERYIKYTVLSKMLTADSINYVAERYIFDKGSSAFTNEIVELKYERNKIIAEIPFDYLKPEYYFVTRKLYLNNYCGTKLWTYDVKQNRGLRYCSIDNCWGNNDVPGPAPEEETTYSCGMGIYFSLYADAIISPSPTSDYIHSQSIIYFKKDGIICGNESYLGINENSAADKLFSIYPVPAKEFIRVLIPKAKSSWLTISSINGREVMKQQLFDPATQIDISKLTVGIYLVKLVSDQSVAVKKITKQ
jgi:hypothetical protein